MSVATELTRMAQNAASVDAAKAAIAAAITTKGGTVASADGLEDFPAAIAGIPSSGSIPAQVESITVTDYTHAEDWLDNTQGLANIVASTYAPMVAGECHVYILKCTNNTAASRNFSGGLALRTPRSTGSAPGMSYRENYTNYADGSGGTVSPWGPDRALYISAGSNIHVVDIKMGVTA